MINIYVWLKQYRKLIKHRKSLCQAHKNIFRELTTETSAHEDLSEQENELDRLTKYLQILDRFYLNTNKIAICVFTLFFILFSILSYSLVRNEQIKFIAKIVTNRVTVDVSSTINIPLYLELIGDYIDVDVGVAEDACLKITHQSTEKCSKNALIKFNKQSTVQTKAYLNRLQLYKDTTLTLNLDDSALFIDMDIDDGYVKAEIELKDNFKFFIDDKNTQNYFYKNISQQKKANKIKLFLDIKEAGQLDIQPKLDKLSLLNIPTNHVGFSRESDLEINNTQCFIEKGEIRLPDFKENYKLHEGDCLSLNNFNGSVSIKGEEKHLIISILGSSKTIKIGPEIYQVDETPSLYKKLMKKPWFQATLYFYSALILAYFTHKITRD